MKKKAFKILMLTSILVLLLQLNLYAVLGELTLTAKTDKDSYVVGEKVIVTIDWIKDVESAGFVLEYDKTKLSFDSTTLGTNFYNAKTEGKILFCWAAFDGIAKNSVTFTFISKVEGEATILVKEASGFADAELVKATGYTYNNKLITISNLQQEEPDNNGEDNNDNTDDNKGENKPGDDTTSTDNKIPQTGIESTLALTIAILSVLGTIVFIKYKKLSDI